jgi:phosphoesterase RecJ-like protein
LIEKFKALLNKYDKVTVLTHCSPDGDTLGTGLGIYLILKNTGKQVEICNIDKKFPKDLEFLPHFAKIKSQIDFDNSLIITCDSGSIDLLGFDLSLREIINIDHHKSNTNYGALNVVDSTCASASMVAYQLLKNDFKMTKDVATCFYVALLTDTQNFITLNVNKNVFIVASELIALGINLFEVNKNLTQRKSLSSFKVLSATLDTLDLCEEAQLATMVLSQNILNKTGARLSDTVGLIDYGIALVTVKIAILVIEFPNYLKVSFRSDGADVSSLAVHFGGGGHLMASGFKSNELDIDLVLKKIKKEIKKRGLINES